MSYLILHSRRFHDPLQHRTSGIHRAHHLPKLAAPYEECLSTPRRKGAQGVGYLRFRFLNPIWDDDLQPDSRRYADSFSTSTFGIADRTQPQMDLEHVGMPSLLQTYDFPITAGHGHLHFDITYHVGNTALNNLRFASMYFKTSTVGMCIHLITNQRGTVPAKQHILSDT